MTNHINTMLTGAAGILSIRLSALIENTDISSLCTISVSIATILKIYIDIKRNDKNNRSGNV